MHIAYDLHGTIDIAPKVFREVMQGLRRNGDKVSVISGPPTAQVHEELLKIGFKQGVDYDEAIGVVTWLLEQGHQPTKIDSNGNYWFKEEAWWSSKAAICEEHKVTLIIDNETQYADYFVWNNTTFTLAHVTKSDPPTIIYFDLKQRTEITIK